MWPSPLRHIYNGRRQTRPTNAHSSLGMTWVLLCLAALYALTLAYTLTGASEWMSWLRRVHDYCYAHFADGGAGARCWTTPPIRSVLRHSALAVWPSALHVPCAMEPSLLRTIHVERTAPNSPQRRSQLILNDAHLNLIRLAGGGGEWFGYCNRDGSRLHDCKGGNYKGCFHVPRALLMCMQCAEAYMKPTKTAGAAAK